MAAVVYLSADRDGLLCLEEIEENFEQRGKLLVGLNDVGRALNQLSQGPQGNLQTQQQLIGQPADTTAVNRATRRHNSS